MNKEKTIIAQYMITIYDNGDMETTRLTVDEQGELHRLQKFPDLRCRLYPHLEVQNSPDPDDRIGRNRRSDTVLVKHMPFTSYPSP